MSSAWTGQSGSPTRLLLLRHGQTVLSIDRRYSGHGDPELTTIGWAQAAGAAARLATFPEITSVLTSPLRRARQTAESEAQTTGAPLEVREGLIETDFGEWEGLTFVEARERDPELHAKWLGAEDVAPPGGESFTAVLHPAAALRALRSPDTDSASPSSKPANAIPSCTRSGWAPRTWHPPAGLSLIHI